MQAEITVPWVTANPLPLKARGSLAEKQYTGDGRDILLQGFHWDSHAGILDPVTRMKKSWYRILQDNAASIRAAGFSWVWFPPASDSVAPQGYIPRRWNVLDTAFGTEAELAAAIRALGPVKALADVVVNHRVGVATSGADFEDPEFPNNRAAISKNDASGVGTGNAATGERYEAGGRELDHTNPDVRATVKNYLHRLKDVGFKGWRYDLVKGYHGKFVGEYNDATAPDFSVGEFYDGDRQKITQWVDSTGGKSTAFDFPLRYLLYDACTKDDYRPLCSRNDGREVPGGFIGFWPSRSVTFLDNHDTECRRDQEHGHQNDTRHFPGKMAAMGYAYILTHPGIPCVFWHHYFDWGELMRQRIVQLIQVRKNAGIHACSFVDIQEARNGLYAAIIDGNVAVKLGSRDWSPGTDWQLSLYGDKFAVWTRGNHSARGQI